MSIELRALAARLAVAGDALQVLGHERDEDARDVKVATLRGVMADIADDLSELAAGSA